MLTSAERERIRKVVDRGGVLATDEARKLLAALDYAEAELKRIANDKNYLIQANLANDWEDRYKLQQWTIDHLREALGRYGKHDEHCASTGFSCICGFEVALQPEAKDVKAL